MDYEYDVFLSYRRQKPSGTWVSQHFMPYFADALGNSLAREAKIFVDTDCIHAGEKWPARLRQALAHSKCLLGIWTPLYFRSEWCQCECEVMRHREAKLGLGTTQKPAGLIIGVKANDGQNFPDFAKDTHSADMEQVFFDGIGFTHCPEYVELQRKVLLLAQEVARIVTHAPTWSAEWLTPPWLDDVIAGIQAPPCPRVEQPLIT